MRLKISTEQQLQEHLIHCKLPISSKIQQLAKELYCMCDEGESLSLSVHTKLIAPSYLIVPAMFAKAITNIVSAPAVQSWVSGEYMHIHMGEEKVPTTFRAKGVAGLKGGGVFKAWRKEIPLCYQTRPAVFSHILSAAYGGMKIYVDETSKSITWKL